MTEDQELELFAIKSKFFRDIPHPKLILKALNQVEKMVNYPPLVSDEVLPINSLEERLQHHSDRSYALKSAISRADRPETLYVCLQALYTLHQNLVDTLASFVPEGVTLPETTIKQSDPLDSYKVLAFLKEAGLAEDQIKGYICAEMNKGLDEPLSLITRVCIQAVKINSNGRSSGSTERIIG